VPAVFGLERMIDETLDVYREVRGEAPVGAPARR
jgi:hypothetical protein